jgi:hypothetical protein
MVATKDDACVGRRDLLCGGGATLLSAMLAALLGDAKPARAAPIFGPVPEIDRVTVSVVVDNYQFAVAPNAKVGNVDIRRFGWGLSNRPPSKTLISEFGLSLHAESQRGEERRRVLVDFGFTPEALVSNLDLLKIDPAAPRRARAEPRPLRPFRRLGRVLAAEQPQLKGKTSLLCRRRGVLLFPRVGGASGKGQLWCARPQGFERG